MFKKIGKALKKFFAFFILKEPELEPPIVISTFG